MYSMLSLRRLRWIGHVRRMDDGRIPKDIFFGELQTGRRSQGRPLLRYKDVCKRDMIDTGIDNAHWEHVAAERVAWRATIRSGIKTTEKMIAKKAHTERERRKMVQNGGNDHVFTCTYCGQTFAARIGLTSHTRHRHGS